MSQPLVRSCICGLALREWRYTTAAGKATGVWAMSLADLVDFQTRRPTRHDVLDLHGRRVQRGRCGEAAPRPREK